MLLAVFVIDNVCFVALRKESVDRNFVIVVSVNLVLVVALRKESVDRNWFIWR